MNDAEKLSLEAIGRFVTASEAIRFEATDRQQLYGWVEQVLVDLLRSNSELASNEYFMPVMGLIFLRHAYSRFLAVKPEIEKSLPSRHGVTRALGKEDFSQRGSIFLRPQAQFDYFIAKASDPKLAVEQTLSMGCHDGAAIRHLLTAEQLNRPVIAAIEIGDIARYERPLR